MRRARAGHPPRFIMIPQFTSPFFPVRAPTIAPRGRTSILIYRKNYYREIVRAAPERSEERRRESKGREFGRYQAHVRLLNPLCILPNRFNCGAISILMKPQRKSGWSIIAIRSAKRGSIRLSREQRARDFQSFWNGTSKANLIQASIIGRTDPPGGTNFRPSMVAFAVPRGDGPTNIRS